MEEEDLPGSDECPLLKDSPDPKSGFTQEDSEEEGDERDMVEGHLWKTQTKLSI